MPAANIFLLYCKRVFALYHLLHILWDSKHGGVNEQHLLLGYIYDILTFEYTKFAFNGNFQLGEQKNWEIILQVGGPELKC